MAATFQSYGGAEQNTGQDPAKYVALMAKGLHGNALNCPEAACQAKGHMGRVWVSKTKGGYAFFKCSEDYDGCGLWCELEDDGATFKARKPKGKGGGGQRSNATAAMLASVVERMGVLEAKLAVVEGRLAGAGNA